MKNVITSNPKIVLPLSLRFAKEYLNKLSEMQKNINSVQESKELTVIHRALWTSLIIEIGRLFDTYDTKDVVSFKKLAHLKKQINKYHGESIVGKIIETRKTFTGHFAKKANTVITAHEICNSNLGQILDEMGKLPIQNSTSE